MSKSCNSKDIEFIIDDNSKINNIIGQRGCLEAKGNIEIIIDDEFDLYEVLLNLDFVWISSFTEERSYITDEKNDEILDFLKDKNRDEDFYLLNEFCENDLSSIGEFSIKEIMDKVDNYYLGSFPNELVRYVTDHIDINQTSDAEINELIRLFSEKLKSIKK